MCKKILFIDDNIDVLMIARLMLKDLGYAVVTASGGVIGLEVLKEIKVDLIFLDLMMPDMNGIEVLKIIKSDKELAKIPVILQTGAKYSDSINEAEILGVNSVIFKPYNKKDLKKIIEQAFKA